MISQGSMCESAYQNCIFKNFKENFYSISEFKLFKIQQRWLIFLHGVLLCFFVGLIAASPDILQPFILGCDTKNPKVVQMSLTAIQRQISQQTINMVWKSCFVLANERSHILI